MQLISFGAAAAILACFVYHHANSSLRVFCEPEIPAFFKREENEWVQSKEERDFRRV
ncbi:MAG: hypothetical protein BYD32DRAFT_402840 [Podila humilis]|nr:MAG: hypothetical protein BYD32DRAFT_402840 [Podila humilis]